MKLSKGSLWSDAIRGWRVIDRHDYWVLVESLPNPNRFERKMWDVCNVKVDRDQCESIAPGNADTLDKFSLVAMTELYQKGIKKIESSKALKISQAREEKENKLFEEQFFETVGDLKSRKFALIGELKDIRRSTAKADNLLKVKRVKELAEEINTINVILEWGK